MVTVKVRVAPSAIFSSSSLTVRPELRFAPANNAARRRPSEGSTPITISESARLEVLRRLSRLNRERWQAEQDAAEAARHDVEAARKALAKPRRGARPTLTLVSPPPQPDLF